MDSDELIQQVRDALTVKRVLASPTNATAQRSSQLPRFEVRPVGEAVRAAAPVVREAALDRVPASVLPRSRLGRCHRRG